jgi:hypothetical protein
MSEIARWVERLQEHPRLQGPHFLSPSLSCPPLLTSFSEWLGFPLNKYEIPEILFSEMISTVDHLREERAIFTSEYFQQKKMPRVLSNILSEEIQKLGRSEATHEVQSNPADPIKPSATLQQGAQVYIINKPQVTSAPGVPFVAVRDSTITLDNERQIQNPSSVTSGSLQIENDHDTMELGKV